ncbi:MAG: universal stress protein [Spirulinaceae cyanobacterium SM2_1_0]|nr:universal stress protein [Spirulinaceae cyanobacterium SM2_1_0]
MFKTVLFPVDRSREARHAVDTVVNIVKTYSSRLVLLSVVEAPPEGAEPEVASTEPAATPMSSAAAVEKLLEGARALFAEQGIEVTDTIEREGIPAFVICDVADELDASLIVMGCRGTGLTPEGASESVTNRVINLSPCPVLIVP